MRYILIILVFLSVGAKAQMVIKAHANYRPYAQPAANLLLDDYPNAAAAYSLRKLDKDYTGACIRVRRDSVGQTEQDFGFDASGVVDTNGIKNFLRNNNGFVTVFYDQSGNGRNASQSTSTRQPSIFESGFRYINGKVVINFQGGVGGRNDLLIIPSLNASVSDWSVFAAINNVGNTGARYFIDAQTGRLIYLIRDNSTSTDKYGFFDGAWKLSTTAATTGNQLLSWLLGTNGQMYRNGTSILNTSYTQKAMSGTIGLGGAFDAGGAMWGGTLGEVIIYNSYQSSNRTSIENNINDYYNIYWNGDFTGILDTYPNSAAAYSLRNLSSTYKGPLIRVRKDTTGQPEMDIYGDYYGNLDTVGLKNFLLTRSGFVTTWYDQSGNGRNATQATQANQPRIALNGVIDRRSGDLAIVYDGSNDYLENNTNGFSVNNFSHYAVSSRGNDADANRTVYSTGILAARDGFGIFYATNATLDQNRLFEQIRGGATAHSVGNYINTINTNNLFFGIGTSSIDYAYYNGGNEQTITHTRANVTSNGRIVIGSRADQTIPPSYIHFLNGTTTEIVFWEANQSSNRTGIQNNINSYYSIY